MREKRKNFVCISEVLAKARGSAALRSKMKSWRLLDCWEEMVGSAVAAHARPARWQNKTLVIRVANPSWMQELSFMKTQITERVRKEFPASDIREIKLELGELPPLPASRNSQIKQEIRPLSDDDREFIEMAVERIADDNLREAARRAMTRGFEKRRG